MNTFHHIASFRFALLLLVLAPGSLAQASPDDGFLPEGIEATGDTTEVRALNTWAEGNRNSHPGRAEQVAQRALTLARELDDQQGIGQSLKTLGNISFPSDLGQAEAYYTAAREAYEQIDDERGVVKSRLNLGNVYKSRGDLERALTVYFDALKGFEHLGDTKLRVGVLNNIGKIHRSQGNLSEALVYYEQAITLVETLDDPRLLVILLNNLGNARMDQAAYEQAETTFRRALTISEERGFQRYTAGISNNLGHLFNIQGYHERALPFLFVAERLGNELEDREVLSSVYDELGNAYLGLEQYDRALHYANESLTLSQEGGSMSDQMRIHQTLSQVYEAIGNDRQALTHHRQYAVARDSVFTAEKTEIVSEMQTRYETEEKQRAIERFEQENRIQTLQLTLLLAGVGGLILLLGLLFSRYRHKQRANRLLEETDVAKSRFFANISHEFRTPLTLLRGPLEDQVKGLSPSQETTQAMLRNTRQLQRLVDEVLELNRLEAGKLELNRTPGDLVRTLRQIVEADAPLAERNGIDLTFEHDVEHCPRLYDQAKLEKIVGNLLSNALKFTPRDGAVCVELQGNAPIEIAVSDTGPGIPEEAQANVFERFAQAEDGPLHDGLSAVPGTAQAGTGIGLALAKELAELHGGRITLESELGQGSTFAVRLPLEKTTLDEIEAPLQRNIESLSSKEFAVGGDGHEERQDGVVPSNGDVEVPPSGGMVAQQTEEKDGNPDRTTVLIIEDNADVRAYVQRSLEERYRVLEAADGEIGLQQARSELPDLIVSDVMLPGIDGYEVARRLKAEPTTECIPVVMLTARAAEEDQTEGYGSGAEVYITKPFSPETLRAAVARLLEERQRLRRRLQENAKREGEPVSGNGRETLADRARTVVLENLHDEDFGVEELASALGISHRSLYRHLKPEVGLSPGDFVRDVRLERARQLLSDGAGSVSEVAYAVGFKSLSHFTRTFRERYGTLPSSVLEAQES